MVGEAVGIVGDGFGWPYRETNGRAIYNNEPMSGCHRGFFTFSSQFLNFS